jgi:hypothetical protein
VPSPVLRLAPTATKETTMSLRPLGLATEIIDDLKLEVTYAYDDLLFVEHNTFILQFDDARQKNFRIYFNAECEAGTAARLEQALSAAARARECSIESCGKFELAAPEGSSEFQVRFLP